MRKIYRKIKQIVSKNSDNNKTVPYITSQGLLRNIFNHQYKKNALVSFITDAINQPVENISHTNILECKTICQILNELGYNVDVIDYNNEAAEIVNNYDLIVGFGFPLENILINGNRKNYKLILYRNGCDHSFQDQASLLRVEDVYKRTGKLLIKSSRLSPASWRAQIRFADLIIAIGNQFVSNTYLYETSGKIESLDLFYHDVNTIDFSTKNFEKSKMNFLWFGSFGAIHKGLDLAIDYFSTRPEIDLFICGLNPSESDFIELYQQQLALPNIHNLGFVQLQSSQFKETLSTCGAIITPSASEGGAAASLNVIAAGGLIPIITESSGVSFHGYEIIIKELSQAGLDHAIRQFSMISPENLRWNSISINKFVRHRYSYENFRNNLKNILSAEIVNESELSQEA